MWIRSLLIHDLLQFFGLRVASRTCSYFRVHLSLRLPLRLSYSQTVISYCRRQTWCDLRGSESFSHWANGIHLQYYLWNPSFARVFHTDSRSTPCCQKIIHGSSVRLRVEITKVIRRLCLTIIILSLSITLTKPFSNVCKFACVYFYCKDINNGTKYGSKFELRLCVRSVTRLRHGIVKTGQ